MQRLLSVQAKRMVYPLEDDYKGNGANTTRFVDGVVETMLRTILARNIDPIEAQDSPVPCHRSPYINKVD